MLCCVQANAVLCCVCVCVCVCMPNAVLCLCVCVCVCVCVLIAKFVSCFIPIFRDTPGSVSVCPG